jgi:hypothetical protein
MEIPHAKRAILQTTFSPIDFEKKQDGIPPRPNPGRPAIERAAPLRRFRPSAGELAAALDATTDPHQTAILEAVKTGDPVALVAAVYKHDEPQDTVVPALIEILAQVRRARVTQGTTTILDWIKIAEDRVCTSAVDAALAHIPSPRDGKTTRTSERDTGEKDTGENPDAKDSSEQSASMQASTPPQPGEPGTGGGGGAPAEPIPIERMRARLRPDVCARLHGPCTPGGRLSNVLASGQCPDAALSDALAILGVSEPEQLDAALEHWKGSGSDGDKAPKLPTAFEPPQPVGYLHLERITFVPAGVEHGELIYSLALAPGEYVAISHKEWSATEEEFLKVISDQFEDYSEQGVVDTTDMSQSTSAERQHTSGFNVSVSVSGGYGPVSGTINTGYSTSQSESDSRQYTLNRSNSMTKKASARSRKEHKISFRLARKTQVEDQTTRLIRNPDPFNPVRYDYYQLMRKWRVNLHRYGVRLTYDITIPEPASDLLGPYIELEQLNTLLEKGFEFNVNPNFVNRTNYVYFATKYGVTLEPPPPLVVSVQAMKLSGPWSAEEWQLAHLDELHVAAPEGYKYLDANLDAYRTWYDEPSDAKREAKVENPHGGDYGVTADIGFAVFGDDVASILSSARVWFVLREDVERAWQVKAYEAIREAASKDYLEKRQMLEARRARIKAELASRDALTLRKIEREELMKGVLRWLFGPQLRFAPEGASSPYYDLEGKVISEDLQTAVLDHGAMISFLHQAIEWENINSFLYPYFWTPRERWGDRMRIEHNDPFHEAFLRAGAARVVLPIRPGWEKAFLSVLKTGTIDGLDGTDDPYLTIAEEIENYAKTNYPGIIPANPADIDPEKATEQSEGILIGSWYEYTPTSAIDIKIGESGPSEGEYRPTTFNPLAPWSKVAQIADAATEVLKALAAKLSPSQP